MLQIDSLHHDSTRGFRMVFRFAKSPEKRLVLS